MISTLLTILFYCYFGAFGLSILLTMVYQSRLFGAYSRKKKPDFPLTVRELIKYRWQHGYESLGSNFTLFPIRLKILFSRYPEDREIDKLASKTRFFLFSAIAIWLLAAMTIFIVAILKHPTPYYQQ